jgi:hypothetical protein
VTRRIGEIENKITALQTGGAGSDKSKESNRALIVLVISGAALVVTIVALVLLATARSDESPRTGRRQPGVSEQVIKKCAVFAVACIAAARGYLSASSLMRSTT